MVDALVLNLVVVEGVNRHLEGLKLARPDHSQEARNAEPDLLYEVQRAKTRTPPQVQTCLSPMPFSMKTSAQARSHSLGPG